MRGHDVQALRIEAQVTSVREGHRTDYLFPTKRLAAAVKAVDDPDRVKLAQEAQQAFRDDYMFIPWYAQAMSRWATAAVKNIDKNLDWQVIAPWDVSIG